jgi:hypothetical protein
MDELLRARSVRLRRLNQDRMAGAALVMVLWFVMALSVLAVSMSNSVRVDLRATQIAVDEFRARVLGDAGIHLALREIEARPEVLQYEFDRDYDFDGYSIRVSVRPGNAFVNINVASADLIKGLLSAVGGVDDERAERLADAILAWRGTARSDSLDQLYILSASGFRARYGRFVAPEDLLQVLGFDYRLYAKIKNYVTVYGASVGVNWMHASVEVLVAMLGEQRRGAAEAIVEARTRDGSMATPPELDGLMLDTSHGEVLRVKAAVLVNGVEFERLRWVSWPTQQDHSRPWLTLSHEIRHSGS